MSARKWNRAVVQAENDNHYLSVASCSCCYCGSDAVLLDHVPPLYSVWRDGWSPFVKVAACWLCNEQLGKFDGQSPYGRVDQICSVEFVLSKPVDQRRENLIAARDLATVFERYEKPVDLWHWAQLVSNKTGEEFRGYCYGFAAIVHDTMREDSE